MPTTSTTAAAIPHMTTMIELERPEDRLDLLPPIPEELRCKMWAN